MVDGPPRTYEEFWPYYVSEHLGEVTRRLHFAGTALGIACLLAAVLVSPWFLPAAFVAGYAFAWVGHFFYEKNRPATFTYPLWSLRGDFRMFKLMMLGKMDAEVERARRLYPGAGAGSRPSAA